MVVDTGKIGYWSLEKSRDAGNDERGMVDLMRNHAQRRLTLLSLPGAYDALTSWRRQSIPPEVFKINISSMRGNRL
ncbi:hypothetical protein Hamer_G005356 [Homarus americanus]|uniref:Uncharacterized protein n=1 Tax=Homarus americanus TaxID=6706 RepID=A0A8J5JYY4_HOMAM|nr:hypothetical protein Hamer_G005356 [Homarus americanus]